MKTAKEADDVLRAKYYDLRPAVATSKLRELATYKKKEEDSIQVTWSKLLKIKTDIVAIKPKLRESYDENEMIMRLLDSLPESYASTVDGLKARETLKVNDALRILQDKEGGMEQQETSMLAHGNKYRAPQKRHDNDKKGYGNKHDDERDKPYRPQGRNYN